MRACHARPTNRPLNLFSNPAPSLTKTRSPIRILQTQQQHNRKNIHSLAIESHILTSSYRNIKMPSAQYTEVYQKVSKMGEKLKAAGKQGPSNDEQLNVCSPQATHASSHKQGPRTRT